MAWLLAVCAAPSLGAQRAQLPADGLIVGQVVDAESGRPIARATVWLGGAPTPARVVTQATPTRILTGSDGRFVFRDLPPGTYSVVANRNGYLAGTSGQRHPGGSSQPIVLPAGGRIGDAVVRLWRPASIGGTVMDEAGEPVVRTPVAALRLSVTGGRPHYAVARQALTDDRGAYRIGGLAPGAYIVAMSAAPMAVPRDLAREQYGAPPGVTVPHAVQLADYVVQISNGVPTPPPPGDGRLRLYAPTFHPASDSATQAGLITLRPGDDYGAADIQLRPSGVASVRGEVTGLPPGFTPQVQLVRADATALAPEMPGPSMLVSPDGEFVFPGVADGEYVLRASGRSPAGGTAVPGLRPPMLWASEPVTVSGADVSVTLALREGLRIRGHVQFDGTRPAPAPGQFGRIPLVAEPAYGAPLVSLAGYRTSVAGVVDAGGAFAIEGLPGGAYVLRVTASPQGWMFAGAYAGGRDISANPVTISSDLDGVLIRFTDRWTGLQGTVRDGRGLGDPDASVLVFPYDSSEWEGYGPNPRRLRLARTTATGSYAFDPLPAGDYYAIALRQEPAEWRDPSALETLSRSAQRITVRSDGKTQLDLRTR